MVYDLIIIGAGPAGITAAIYAARHKLNFLVISMDIGGQAWMSSDVENYTGYHFLNGKELVKKFEEHLHDYKVNLKLMEEVLDIRKKGKICYVKSTNRLYKSKTIIIASGKEPRKLNVPGEKKLYNRGVSYCAVCDAPLFKNKTVAIIGGSNSALDAASCLMKYAKKIYLININPKIYGEPVKRENVLKNKKVALINNAKTTKIIGNKSVEGIIIAKDSKQKKLNVQGVFVEIGYISGCDFAPLVKKNKRGEIKIKRSTKSTDENLTSVPGIFAAGDCTDIPDKQIIIAAGEGAKAALACFDYLSSQKGG